MPFALGSCSAETTFDFGTPGAKSKFPPATRLVIVTRELAGHGTP